MDGLTADQRNIMSDILGLVSVTASGDREAASQMFASLCTESPEDLLSGMFAHVYQLTVMLAEAMGKTVEEFTSGVQSQLASLDYPEDM